MDDIQPRIHTADDIPPAQLPPVLVGPRGQWFNGSVEVYLNGFASRAVRTAIDEALNHMESNAGNDAVSRTERAVQLANLLRDHADQITSIANGIRQRSTVTTSIAPPR